MLATCPSFPLLPPCCAAVAAGCRAAAATALGSSSVVTSSATGCCWLCCCLSGVTLARGVGLRWRHFLLGRRSHRADLHNPIDLCEGALPLGHVFVEASTTRGHGEFPGATLMLPQLRARKVGSSVGSVGDALLLWSGPHRRAAEVALLAPLGGARHSREWSAWATTGAAVWGQATLPPRPKYGAVGHHSVFTLGRPSWPPRSFLEMTARGTGRNPALLHRRQDPSGRYHPPPGTAAVRMVRVRLGSARPASVPPR